MDASCRNRRYRSRRRTAVGVLTILVLLLVLLFHDREISSFYASPQDIQQTGLVTSRRNQTNPNQEQLPTTNGSYNNSLDGGGSVPRSKNHSVEESNAYLHRTTTPNANLSFGSTTTSLVTSKAPWHGPPISIVVQLSGEMGNHLHKIALGRVIQIMAQQEYGIVTRIILQRQERGGKWMSARRDVQQCFPHFRDWDFELGNGREFTQRFQQQSTWLGTTNAQRLEVIQKDPTNSTSTIAYTVKQTLNFLQGLLQGSHNITQKPPEYDKAKANISLPFIYSKEFVDFYLMDQFYADLKNLFAFDEAACCNHAVLSDPEESVFHFRNYIGEMPRRAKSKGFEELSPEKVATELLGHLEPGSKVAITTRVHNNISESYVRVFEERGWRVRVLTGNTGVQDFCFLWRAQKELAGIARSTFVQWSAFLGRADVVWLYTVDSPNTRTALGNSWNHHLSSNHTWTHPDLQRRIHMVTIQSEEAIQEQQKK